MRHIYIKLIPASCTPTYHISFQNVAKKLNLELDCSSAASRVDKLSTYVARASYAILQLDT